jgi:hypothetical protein
MSVPTLPSSVFRPFTSPVSSSTMCSKKGVSAKNGYFVDKRIGGCARCANLGGALAYTRRESYPLQGSTYIVNSLHC